MTGALDDTVVMRDDTDVMPACQLPAPPAGRDRTGHPVRACRRAPTSPRGRRRADLASPAARRASLGLTLIAFALAAATVHTVVEAQPVFRVLGPYVYVDVEVGL